MQSRFALSKTSFLLTLVLLAAISVLYSCTTAKVDTSTGESRRAINAEGSRLIDEGRKIFRFDTFGSEAFWEKTRLHDAIAGEKNGGTGSGLSPNQALELA